MLCSSATFPGKAAATAEKLIPLFPRQRSPFYSRRGQNHDQKMHIIQFQPSPWGPRPARPVQSGSPSSTLPARRTRPVSQSRCSCLILSIQSASPQSWFAITYNILDYIHGYVMKSHGVSSNHSAYCRLGSFDSTVIESSRSACSC